MLYIFQKKVILTSDALVLPISNYVGRFSIFNTSKVIPSSKRTNFSDLENTHVIVFKVWHKILFASSLYNSFSFMGPGLLVLSRMRELALPGLWEESPLTYFLR